MFWAVSYRRIVSRIRSASVGAGRGRRRRRRRAEPSVGTLGGGALAAERIGVAAACGRGRDQDRGRDGMPRRDGGSSCVRDRPRSAWARAAPTVGGGAGVGRRRLRRGSGAGSGAGASRARQWPRRSASAAAAGVGSAATAAEARTELRAAARGAQRIRADGDHGQRGGDSHSGTLRPASRNRRRAARARAATKGGRAARIGTGSGATAVRSSSPVRREGVGVVSGRELPVDLALGAGRRRLHADPAARPDARELGARLPRGPRDARSAPDRQDLPVELLGVGESVLALLLQGLSTAPRSSSGTRPSGSDSENGRGGVKTWALQQLDDRAPLERQRRPSGARRERCRGRRGRFARPAGARAAASRTARATRT